MFPVQLFFFILVSVCDTMAAILAGFVVIPSAFGAGVDMQSGPRLLFDVMAGIFANLPGGRLIGSFFFIGVTFAVISSLFTFFEISMKTFEVKLKMGRKKAVGVVTAIILAGAVLVSLNQGALEFTLPFPSFQGIQWYSLFDWLDCFTAYVLLPGGCLATSIFVTRVWKFDAYEKELTANGRDGHLKPIDKFLVKYVVPFFMIVVLLNVFGVIK